jgi:hypothetical protein
MVQNAIILFAVAFALLALVSGCNRARFCSSQTSHKHRVFHVTALDVVHSTGLDRILIWR